MLDIDELAGNVLGSALNLPAPAESLAAGANPKNPAAKKTSRSVKSRLSLAVEKASLKARAGNQSEDEEEDDDPQIIACLRAAEERGEEMDIDAETKAKLLKEALEAQIAGDSAKADQILAKIHLKSDTTTAGPATKEIAATKRNQDEEEIGSRVKENGAVFYKA
ncbi:hypothetical protein PtA15_3A18 [Puccinia triticina]|uniref:Nascent polypeptide-associated complex subunit alpha-like UBA domain-containing protein n=1 Tax=Puccinia triticina TaxID=208348 RepID=A0ABY7CFN8_9BASI|nr:uncharacterized protein PtA15_3A18 [Puccinia triticina]WAQ82655.1 hypothetical protein PtA15_3A18 [Puccinia triticina]